MNGDLWVGALTTMVGAGMGGTISLALHRQQIKEARAQRTHADLQARGQRSEDRRFAAYIDFSVQARSYRDAIRPFKESSTPEVRLDDLSEIARVVNTASALVFMVVESEATYGACLAIVLAIAKAQDALRGETYKRSAEAWTRLDDEVAELVREFQVAARNELGISGLDKSLILNRNVLPPRIATDE